ncbi:MULTISPECIES: hypothetical protein [unclassified Rhizobium]|uniref:hypothetical protein n=1 Tax=unclassified Rhizobium TaxID=2613769 RepID=UPI0006FB8113|nr:MULTISPECIES: hypothetical protein [unclassified Rhizobium]KQV35122.1 hypothetical protein ASC86_12975 [Rhizobium sp. Root1212]KRD24927.1 hypothetical protein ASE37_12970 [Rhizobium sp. Root268]
MGYVIGKGSLLLSAIRRRLSGWRMERIRKRALQTIQRREGTHLLDDAGMERLDTQAGDEDQRSRPWML